MAKFVRSLQLPADKHKRSLPKQTGINLMAAMGVVQQLIFPAAPSPPEQVEPVGQVERTWYVCGHLVGRQCPPLPQHSAPHQWWNLRGVACTAGQAAAGVCPRKQGRFGEAGRA